MASAAPTGSATPYESRQPLSEEELLETRRSAVLNPETDSGRPR